MIRIWQPVFWGVLVLLKLNETTTSHKPTFNNDDFDNSSDTSLTLDDKQSLKRTERVQNHSLTTYFTITTTTNTLNNTNLTDNGTNYKLNKLNGSKALQGSDNNYKLSKEHPTLEKTVNNSHHLSESFTLQLLSNKKIKNHIHSDVLGSLSIANVGNTGHGTPTIKPTNESVHTDDDNLPETDDNNNFTLENRQRLENENPNIASLKLLKLLIENKTESGKSARAKSTAEHRTNANPSGSHWAAGYKPGGNVKREELIYKSREVEEAADYGLRMMNELISVKEPQLFAMGLWLNRDDPAGRVAAFNAPNPEASNLFRYGYASLQASTKLLEQLSSFLESRTSPVRLPAELRESLRATALHSQCPLLDAPLPCRPAAKRYRTADGSCNNPDKPRWGAALKPFQRFLAPRYHDGLQTPRRSVVQSVSLPSARVISTHIHRPHQVDAPSVTLLLMQWGQFIDHDVTSTPQSRAFNGTTPRCCETGGTAFLAMDLMHPDCMPIEVPSDDWFFARFGLRCMEFVRSAPTVREGCDFGHRQQLNQVTSYIDASTIYGSSVSQADPIRLFRGGLIHYGRPDPPNGGEPCRSGAVSIQCLRPGDGRASEQPALTSLHITWVRKHNMLATALAHLNPHWSDEKMFQETRRIVGALIQHITYGEYIPIILGHEVTKLFDLELIRKGYYTNYETRVNPAISNGFSAAAYRFGHSLVQSSFVRTDRFHRPMFTNVSIHEEQSNENLEHIWSPGSVDRLILGLANQPSQRRDEFISDELTNHLFQSPGRPFGMDLAAINIQRGRDHGVPPYTAWREPCGLSPIHNWTDLQRVMAPETAERFRSTYLSVDDIDLYSAGLAERPVRGGLVGPTFACIIAQQFSNLRKGDRFWYENGDFESSFNPAQLQQIRKVTLAQIICETMTQVDTIQPFVFLTADNFRNRRDMCRNLVDFDLTPWIEKTTDFTTTNTVNKVNEQRPLSENDVEMKSRLIVNEKNSTTFNTSNSDFTKRTKRHTDSKPDQIEHRQSDDDTDEFSLPLTDYELTNDHSDKLTLHMTDHITNNGTDESRNTRKTNQPIITNTRRKTKPKQTLKTTITPTKRLTTARPGINKNKLHSDLKQVSFFTSNYHNSHRPTSYENPSPYYQTYEVRPNHSPIRDDIITKRPPSNNQLTYLFDSVKKTSTTPQPEYQFHIQINYFYNSTTDNPNPTRPTYQNRPTSYDQHRLDNFNYNRPTYIQNKPSTNSRPNRPNKYNVYELDDPIYSSSNTHNIYTNDKIDFGYNRITTRRPPVVTSDPITVIEIKPKPQTQNKPNNNNVYVVNQDNYYGRPTKQPDIYNIFARPPTFENTQPIYETEPNTLIYKRPVTGQVTKLDAKPLVIYGPPDNFYGTEVVYDNTYLDNYDNQYSSTTYRPNSYIDDKLDFATSNNKKFVQIASTKKNVFTTARPYYDADKKYIRISTVKGHATSGNTLSPIYISVQNKEADDLEMTYDDLLEVYVEPDKKLFGLKEDYYDKTKNHSDKTSETETKQKTVPSAEQQNDDSLCSTELPRPMDIFLEDDLLGISY